MTYSVSHDRLRLDRQSRTKPCRLTRIGKQSLATGEGVDAD